ncbi:hypothetical protein EDL98_10630 [Ornithobacterium rhinotracheale]|uniref:phage head morphogenesis protein n=1 Tax=Ornithobacterium rhinotracheale TaxID=28251 RepID=UPI00129C5744|nr:phage minor head protein [Ornithobacterium rhinotracheale]MRJ11520.1 hypothetical protein [Ornithobacterium rhinotracheale]
MSEQYQPCDCPACQAQRERLNLADGKASKMKFKQVLNYAEKAFKTLYEKQGYRPEDLAQITEYKGLINKTAEILSEQIPHETPAEMRQYLEQDVFVFSGLKTHAQLAEARSYLKDEQGNLRAYHDFEQKVLKLNERYNQQYLEAEYEFAAHSAMSASQWANLQSDTERYWLEYHTAGDERVRASHDALRGVCLPKTDPFWDSFYPPNGWRCRCVAVEVLSHDRQLSDPKKAQEIGEKATTQIGKNGKNKLAMFRFNAGKEQKMFPPNHSYKPKFCSNGKTTLSLNTNTLFLSLEDERCRAEQIVKQEAELSAQAKLRKMYLEEMKTLLKKKITKDIGNKTIKVKFTTKGNKHLYSDTFKRSDYPKEELKNIDKRLEKASFVKEAKISKHRKDNIRKFYYFKDNENDWYYNVAEENLIRRDGKIILNRFLYAITKKIK